MEPADLESRDLFYGSGGAALAPGVDGRYQIVAVDSTGYDVRDAQGRTWSVKIGLEAQSEVAVSRILWAIGYHQPPAYRHTRVQRTDGRKRAAQQLGLENVPQQVYEVLDGSPGPRQRYVVRDLGASLGKTSFPPALRWTPMRGFVWTCTLMDRLSDEQLMHAFRAAGYTPEYQRRYAAKVRAKIREGRAIVAS